MKTYDEWKATNPADAELGQPDYAEDVELCLLAEENQRLRSALEEIVYVASLQDRSFGLFGIPDYLIEQARRALEAK